MDQPMRLYLDRRHRLADRHRPPAEQEPVQRVTRSQNPLLELRAWGQSPWCDQLSRRLLSSGQLGNLVSRQGIVGLTSNPTIFRNALAEGDWYDADIRTTAASGMGTKAIYEQLAVHDIQAVADLLEPVYLKTDRRDGYVSFEVSPDLAYNAEESVAEARRLWAAVDRPNLMIKIPGTRPGLWAITMLLAQGVNVNVTLVFGLERYRQVLAAHAAGLLGALENGHDLPDIASVASFFVSRVDTLVDRLLDFKAAIATDPVEQTRLLGLRGKAAIANARAARRIWEHWLETGSMPALLSAGARPQRLLWASTGTKNPAYRDVRYVEELIGPATVTTLPLETIAAFAQHGRIRGATLTDESAVTDSATTLEALAEARIKMESVAEELESAGVKLFADSFAQLLQGVEAKTQAVLVGESASR